ncbi:metallophosphoesterase family protein [bacterium]|nr:metallophosphoesterase family protein [bacterium]
MKLGIIGDIHANLESLKECLRFLKGKVEKIVVLGDVIGYGPDPSECIEIVEKEAEIVLKGNHEKGIVENDYSRFKKIGEISLRWTKEQLNSEQLKKIETWPEKAEMDDMIFVHGSLSSPLFKYIFKKEDCIEEFALLYKKVCFIAHTHIPGGFRKKEGEEKIEQLYCDFSGKMELTLEDDYFYIINVGSVGQPRDGLPFSCVSIYDTQTKKFNLYRVEYPAEITARKIIGKKLPSTLAERVRKGI